MRYVALDEGGALGTVPVGAGKLAYAKARDVDCPVGAAGGL